MYCPAASEGSATLASWPTFTDQRGWPPSVPCLRFQRQPRMNSQVIIAHAMRCLLVGPSTSVPAVVAEWLKSQSSPDLMCDHHRSGATVHDHPIILSPFR